MMVLSSLGPLFALWAIRGMQPIPDKFLVTACVAMMIIPTSVLFLRLAIARQHGDKRSFTVATADDHKDHLLVYLFAVLIPLFDANVGKARDSAATIGAFLLVVFLFWHLNLHYANVFFAIAGYRVFTIQPTGSAEPSELLTKRKSIAAGSIIHAYRLSDTVFIEVPSK
jgi:hypothetical protein